MRNVSLIDGHIDKSIVTLEETIGYFKDMVDDGGAYELCPCFDNHGEMAKIALTALKREMPKKPVGDLNSVPHYRCSNCFGAVVMYECDNQFPYCHHCGQAIDWSDEKNDR